MAAKKKRDGIDHGYLSGLEDVIGLQLDAMAAPYTYEQMKIPFVQPLKARSYKPDFILLRNGIIIETKGRFVTADRQKHLLVKAQHPNLDIRFVFSNSRQRISKQSPTTYALWATQKGFLFADKRVPVAWLNEKPNLASLAAIAALLEGK